MPGNRETGLKAAQTNKARYGDDYYKKVGQAGGSAEYVGKKGFAASGLAKEAGRKGGESGRGKRKTWRQKIAKLIEGK